MIRMLFQFNTVDTTIHKAILYEIALRTSFVAVPDTFYNALTTDKTKFQYNIDDVVWLTWIKDLISISRLYPGTVIRVIVEHIDKIEFAAFCSNDHQIVNIAWDDLPEHVKE